MAISSSSIPRATEIYVVQKKIERLEMKSRSLGPGQDKEQKKALKAAQKEKRRLQLRLNLSLLLGILLVVTIWLAIARAMMEKTGLFWLIQVPQLPTEVGEFATVLSPLLSISLAIERLLETAFNWYEQSLRTVADILGTPKAMLDWIGREYQEAYDATEEAAKTVGVEPSQESLGILDMAEERLVKAEERLRGWTAAPEYLSWKKALCIWFGLLAGLLVSVLGDLKMLNYIGVPAPRFVDMVITGLVIGAGSGPMHDMIGILQGGKNALGSLSDLAKGKSVKEAVQVLRQSEALQRREDME